MRLGACAGVLVALLATGALAAPGDQLRVVGDVVNMRGGPATDAPIRIQVYRGQEATLVRREGEWAEVELADTGLRGWIFAQLLETVATAPAGRAESNGVEADPAPPAVAVPAAAPAPAAAPTPVEPAAGPGPAAEGVASPPAAPPEAPRLAALPPEEALPEIDPRAVGRFEDSVNYLNQRAMAAAGVDLFTAVRAVDATTVQVVATDVWRSVPASGQESYVNTLFDRWLAAAGSSAPLRLEIVDDAGQVLSARAGP
jgi:uncharacterized protein YgiM (DUF1202 family)